MKSFLKLSGLVLLTGLMMGQSSSSFARPLNVSAKRLKGEHWTHAYTRVLGKYRVQDAVATPLDRAVLFPQFDSSKALAYDWTQGQFASTFFSLRDLRFLPDPDVKGVSRRLSWMYPDDGCFIRAEWLAKQFTEHFKSNQINKIFAFGDLVVKTANSPDGKVSWWYHVVVGWRFGKQIFVYDPAIDPTKPMDLSAWVGAISPDPTQVKVAICGEGAYTPSSDCSETKSLMADGAAIQIAQEYLHSERERLIELNRSPEKELGEHPPWLP